MNVLASAASVNYTLGGRQGVAPNQLIPRSPGDPARAPAGRDLTRTRGFTLLELTVVVVIVALLVVIAIERLLAIQADAERVMMETVVGTLRSALGMKVAESLVKHETAKLPLLEGSNPMDRLAELPPNYLGALDRPDPGTLEDGHWYFDISSRTLVYLVRHKARFEGGLADPPRARFKVQVVYADRNGNGRYDAGVDAVEGLRLAPVEPYRWVQ